MEQNRNKEITPPSRSVERRRCLACGEAFAALGPFLRICGPCKESEEWQSGDADFAVHTGRAANDN